MSLSSGFNSRYIDRSKCVKTGKDIITGEDFRSALIRHADGSSARYRQGKEVPGTRVEGTKMTAKKDVASEQSRYYKDTPVSTIVEKTKGETETAGEKETGARVRKKFDPNARAMKL